MTRTLASIVAGALCLAYAAPSHAGQVTQPMNVSLTIGTPGGEVLLVVGLLVLAGPPSGPAFGSSIIHVTAPANLPYAISLNAGLHAFPGVARTLSSGAIIGDITYGLTADPDGLNYWGDGNGWLGAPVSSAGTGSDQAFVVYAGTSTYFGVSDGTRTDVVTVTVNF